MIEDTAVSSLNPVPAPTRLVPRRRPDGRELLATAKGILMVASSSRPSGRRRGTRRVGAGTGFREDTAVSSIM